MAAGIGDVHQGAMFLNLRTSLAVATQQMKLAMPFSHVILWNKRKMK